jgi:hypothetical protein
VQTEYVHERSRPQLPSLNLLLRHAYAGPCPHLFINKTVFQTFQTANVEPLRFRSRWITGNDDTITPPEGFGSDPNPTEFSTIVHLEAPLAINVAAPLNAHNEKRMRIHKLELSDPRLNHFLPARIVSARNRMMRLGFTEG